ncbi:hypothetical protein LY90DRAFT_212955 [Neocallimastix californiae]|uniref:Uncharacterized protein n=1 Tax=Neocallimastix californiae TaxID=1754190 RepID=A0A1Y2E9K7_9FUNG|nr:hypothetical protein LY90DRAFT_212955 [Neocallimastix californiae]|eukprot:ORY68087.1 hypothetical protein LY90DRAFT_212955 [Neocallimastix californiae]
MEYESLIQYFNSDEDSINAPPPSFMNDLEEEDNIETEPTEKIIKSKKLCFDNFNDPFLEIIENDKVDNVLDIFSDSENEDNSKYSDDSSFTWGNGNNDFVTLTENQIQNTLNNIKRELYDEKTNKDEIEYKEQKNCKLINFEEEEDFDYLDNQVNNENKLSNYNKSIKECQQWSSKFKFLRLIIL